MPRSTRRQFIGTVGSAAATTVIVPAALAQGRPAAASQAPAPPRQWFGYQAEIYLGGTTRGEMPAITTNLSELEARAARRLDLQARRRLLGDAGGASTARANARAFEGWRIIPRMFRAHAERDLRATILGTRMPAPVILGPVGAQRLAHPDGDLASARAAAALELTYVLSARASHSIEAVAGAGGTGSRWLQLEWPDGDELDLRPLRQARAAGYTHLLVTPPAGRGWRRLTAIRRAWGGGRLLLHGVRTARDARDAARRGFDGIVVSNHVGGGADGSVDALPAIREAVGDRRAVLFDSGIRTAPDAYKALALGADAVLVGRPYAYGLALDGEEGVTHVLKTLLAELDLTLAGSGYRSHRELSRQSLAEVR